MQVKIQNDVIGCLRPGHRAGGTQNHMTVLKKNTDNINNSPALLHPTCPWFWRIRMDTRLTRTLHCTGSSWLIHLFITHE